MAHGGAQRLGWRRQRLGVPPNESSRHLPGDEEDDGADQPQTTARNADVRGHVVRVPSRACHGSSRPSSFCRPTEIRKPMAPITNMPTIVMSLR